MSDQLPKWHRADLGGRILCTSWEQLSMAIAFLGRGMIRDEVGPLRGKRRPTASNRKIASNATISICVFKDC
jgi:hypothetical protein